MASIGTIEAFDCLKKRIERLENWKRKVVKQMSDLTKSVQDVADSEQALEDRETAREAADAAQAAHDAEVAAALQAQIDDLTAKLGANDAAVVALNALKAKMDAFDPTAPAPPPGP